MSYDKRERDKGETDRQWVCFCAREVIHRTRTVRLLLFWKSQNLSRGLYSRLWVSYKDYLFTDKCFPPTSLTDNKEVFGLDNPEVIVIFLLPVAMTAPKHRKGSPLVFPSQTSKKIMSRVQKNQRKEAENVWKGSLQLISPSFSNTQNTRKVLGISGTCISQTEMEAVVRLHSTAL